MTLDPTSRGEIARRAVSREPIPSLPTIGRSIIVATQGAAVHRIRRRRRLFGGHVQFSVRSYNLKEGRERTGHVGVRAPDEHGLYFGKFGGQFMHRDLAVPP